MTELSSEYRTSAMRIFLLIISIIIISVLTSLSQGFNIKITAILIIGYIVVFGAGIFITAMLLAIPNSIPIKTYGFAMIIKSVSNGFSFLFPFAVLALLSDYVFNFNAVSAITSAGIFSCISIADSELMKAGGKRGGNLVYSFIASIIFMLIYFAIETVIILLLK